MAVRFLGNTDEVDVCDCCGRKGLKSTVALSIDDGDAVYYGVVCAARALKMDAKAVRSAAKAADDARHEAARRAQAAARNAELARWTAFLFERTGERDIFRGIEKLGGYPAARALYQEVSGTTGAI